MQQHKLFNFSSLLNHSKDSPCLLANWEKLSLTPPSFSLTLFENIKTVLFQHFLIVFNCENRYQKILAFDLKKNQWLRTTVVGDEFGSKPNFSICLYDNNTVILFGARGQEGILQSLFFQMDSNDSGKNLSCFL